MNLRTLVTRLLARCEGAFDRAIRDDATGMTASERAGGEFISTLIIDHGASSRMSDGRRTNGPSRD